MTLQMRPAGAGPSAPFYAPSRDLAHIGPDLLAKAAEGFPRQLPTVVADFIKDYDLSMEELAEAVHCAAQAMTTIIETPGPAPALGAAGFNELPQEVRVAFLAQLGWVFMASVWISVKDCAKPGDEPPASIRELLAHTQRAAQP